MKRINEQTDSSSSESEILENNLKESIDQQFLNDNLYTSKNAKVFPQYGLETSKSNKKSLRTSSKEDKFMNLGITVTFQSFIAKKLDEILEGTILLKSNESIEHCMEQKKNQKRSKDSGIKLLSTSKGFVTETMVTHMKPKEKSKKCRKHHQIAEDEDALSKFREAAVDPERILSKSDTKAWVNKRPEPEFKYKRLKNNVLIEIT